MLIYFVIIHILGFKKGKNLNKVGYKAHDTAELFFEDVRFFENVRFYKVWKETKENGRKNSTFFQLRDFLQ